jgi:CRISPR-associated exonuclease Cas4
MAYKEEDFLQLSGLQHFKFCRRRWALIHIENQWAENFLTVDGALLHKNAHDSRFQESRGDRIIARGIRIFSAALGISGQCDVLEFLRSEEGVPLPGREGLWQPYPVEYKRGSPNSQSGDMLQLCGQALCLEEMLCCSIPQGALFFGEIRRRQAVCFTGELRQAVRESLAEMHDLYRRGHTPKVRPTKACNACSLKEMCLPKLMRKRSAAEYVRQSLGELP